MRVPVFQFAWRQGDTHSRFFLSYLVVLGAFVIIGPSSLVFVGHQPLEVGFSMSFAATLSLGFWKTWYPVAYLCLPVVRRILAFPSLSSRSTELYGLMQTYISKYGMRGRPAGLLKVGYIAAIANVVLILSSFPLARVFGTSRSLESLSLTPAYFACVVSPVYAALFYMSIRHSFQFAKIAESRGYPLLSIRNYGIHRRRGRVYRNVGRLAAVRPLSAEGISGTWALYEMSSGLFRIHVVGADGQGHFIPESLDTALPGRDVAARFPDLWKEVGRTGPIPIPT